MKIKNSVLQKHLVPLIPFLSLSCLQDDPGVLLSAGMAPPSNSFSTLLKTRIYCDQLVPSSTNNPAGAVDLRYNDLCKCISC